MKIKNIKKIKKLTKADIKPTAEMLVAYWKERGMTYSRKWGENYLVKGHKTEILKDEFFVMADEKNKTIGSVSFILYEGNVAEIRDLVVKKEFRNRGFGKDLLAYLVDYCKALKIRKLCALCLKNKVNLLKQAGFEKEGLLKSHFKKGENLTIMSKFL